MWDVDFYFFQPDPAQYPEPWPGLVLSNELPAKRVMPSRRRDTLAVYVRVTGVLGLSPRVPEDLARQAATVFMTEHGPVTRALRRAAEVVHHRVQQANRRMASRGLQARVWWFAQVLHGETLYLAWAGPWHVLAVVRGATQIWHTPDVPPLGLEDTPRLHFAQVPWHLPLALVAANTLEDWPEDETARLLDEPEALLQTWLASRTAPCVGWLTRWDVGTYRVRKHVMPLILPETALSAQVAAPTASQPVPTAGTETVEAPSPRAALEEAKHPAPHEKIPSPPTRAKPPLPKKVTKKPQSKGRQILPKVVFGAMGRGLAAMLVSLARMPIPPRVWAVLSFLVPLLMLAFTLFRYTAQGREMRHRQWVAQAYTLAKQALERPDPDERLAGMEQALAAIREARRYGTSPEADKLEEQIRTWFRDWEGIYFLPFQNVMSATLPPDIRITRLEPGLQGLYALDAAARKVWYFPVTPEGHTLEHDPNFRCVAQTSDTLEFGELVDLVGLPIPTLGYEVAVFDEQGNVLFCAPATQPQARMLPVPTRPWTHIARVRAFQDVFYILDTGQSNVYEIPAGNLTATVPRNLFDPETGPDLSQVVDFALWRGEMFFLYVDGQILHCLFPQQDESEAAVCEPMPFQDTRPDREGKTYAVWPQTAFRRIFLYQGPEPGLFFLDTEQGRVYHFTLKLRYVAQYRPEEPWSTLPTAMTVTEFPGEPYIYLAIAPQVAAAALP